jgi:hypothetical protein
MANLDLIKAIKIDVIRKVVEFVQVENSLEGMHKATECSMIEQVYLGNRHVLLVDEDWNVSSPSKRVNARFLIRGQVYGGHGIIVALNKTGSAWADCTYDASIFDSIITFNTEQ